MLSENNTRMKRTLIAFLFLLVSVLGFAQTNGSQRVLLADKPKYGLLDVKMGRSYLKQMEPSFDEPANVFFGSGGVCVGVIWLRNFIGVGADVEFVDLLDNSISVPLFAQVRHYLLSDDAQGLYAEVRAGYVFGGKKVFSTVKSFLGGYQLQGTTVRSMAGPYGEILLGFTYQRFDFFVSYNYRVINYDTKYLYFNYTPYYATNQDVVLMKTMHTVMGGVGFRLF